MFFEQNLSDVAYQYTLVKDPENYINTVLLEDELPDAFEIQDMFKCTGVYNKLAFDPNDDKQQSMTKQKFVNCFTDILKNAGLALQSIILNDVDKMYAQDIKGADHKIANYFDRGLFMSKISAILSLNDNLIDKASFIITESDLDNHTLESLKNINNFFSDIANYYLNNIEYVKYDIASNKGFNYDNIQNIILPIFITAEVNIANEATTPQTQQTQMVTSKKSQETQSETAKQEENKPKRKILSLEEALDKNFEDLIGLKDVKNAILGKTKLILKVPSKAIACNFRIVGNPGVGKTTVAEAMSRTFYDAGIIKSKEFVSINGAELKAEYVGQTTGKVKKYFKEAHGGTLFLDEVYSLLSSDNDGDSFTQEAITQLMTEIESLYNQQIENPDNKTLVIIAGYKDKVKQLLDKNIGFRRRFPNNLELRDYNLEELIEIFSLFMKKDGFTLEENAKKELVNILERERKKEDFSNAGYVRNLLQSAEENQARRTELDDFKITLEDLKQAEKMLIEEEADNMSKIGFE